MSQLQIITGVISLLFESTILTQLMQRLKEFSIFLLRQLMMPPTDNLPTSEILVPENTRSVLNILDYVSDIDGNITALLVDPKGSNDNNLFEIDPLTQELRFRKELAPTRL